SLEISPNDAAARMGMAELSATRGDYPDAILEYRKIIATNSVFVDPYLGWATILRAQGKLNAAIERYEDITKLNSHPVPYVAWGDTLVEKGDIAGAIEKYRKAIAIAPFYVDAYIAWGSALRLQGQFREAMIVYSKSLSQNPNSAQIHKAWGDMLLETG